MAVFKVEAHELEAESAALPRRHRAVTHDHVSGVVPSARADGDRVFHEIELSEAGARGEHALFEDAELASSPEGLASWDDEVHGSLEPCADLRDLDDDIEPLPPMPAPPELEAEGVVVRWLDRRELLALRAATLHVWTEHAPCAPPIPARVVRAIVATEDVLRAVDALARHASNAMLDAEGAVDGLVRDTHDWVATILAELEEYARANEDPDEAMDLWGTASRAFAEEAATFALARVLPRIAALDHRAGVGADNAPVLLHVASAGAWFRRSVARQVRVLRELARVATW